jgi:hypothetical protein
MRVLIEQVLGSDCALLCEVLEDKQWPMGLPANLLFHLNTIYCLSQASAGSEFI